MYSPTSSLLNAGLETKLIKLHEIFLEMGSTLIAFSGGIDSTLILKIAYDTLGEDAVAVTANSPTFPRDCLLYTSPSPRDLSTSRMPSSA